MFKNPNFNKAAKDRYEKYISYIVEFMGQLPEDQQSFEFIEIRAFFQEYPDPQIAALTDDMTDGILDDLCQRHGIERV